jgi:hypothetical protein
LLLLQAQRDALALAVDAQHLDLDLLVHLHHLARMVDAAPGHVGDVQEAVDAAEVHEHAEVGDVLHRAGADLTLLDVEQEDLLLLLALLLEQLAPADHDVHPIRVDLDDARADRLAQEVGDVVRAAQVDLARGQEHVDALDVDQKTSLDLALHDALDLVALAVLLRHALPRAQTVGAALRDLRRVVLVEPVIEDLVGLARLGQDLAELGDRDGALALPADVHHHHPGALVDRVDGRLHDGARVDVADRRGQRGVEVIGRERAQRGLDLLFQLLRVEVVLLDATGSEGHVERGFGSGFEKGLWIAAHNGRRVRGRRVRG